MRRATRVLAPNPGVMTLEGTNTWVLRQPGAARSVVVDPGPLDAEHLDAVARVAGETAVVLLTHHHLDHAEGAATLADRLGVGLRALDPELCVGAEPLVDGERVAVDGLVLRVVATPGHTADSVCLLLGGDETGSGPDGASLLLSGDTVLGRGTSVVAAPDGDLGAYLDSLRLLRGLVGTEGVTRLLPGHGPVVEEPAVVLEHYLTHRTQRLEQVRGALAEGAVTARDVVERVYAEVDPSLWAAAEVSVEAQLAYLRRG